MPFLSVKEEVMLASEVKENFMNQKLSPGAEALVKKLTEFAVATTPYFHVVLGSGFKDALIGGLPATFSVKGEIPFLSVPGLHPSTAPGHAGKIVVVEHAPTKRVGIIQVGRLHGYEGLDPREVVNPVMFTRELGTLNYFITNAAGGIDAAHTPGDVMVIVDHINFTGKNPLLGLNPKNLDGAEWGPRFPDLTNLYDREWRTLMKPALSGEGLKVHEGVYMGVLGPSFETPAEVRFFRQAGTHAVGMSTVWETIALKHSGARVFALSLISNVAAGLNADPSAELDHFAILDACKSSSTSILKAILLSVEKA
jgi:purine-nucleoside phosphorylase